MADLAAVILTKNEELHLDRALRHISHLAKEVFVIDSFSTDRTIEIARSHGAVVLQHRFVNYASQFKWALENAPITANWILRLDADEIIGANLADRLEVLLPSLPDEVAGLVLQRQHHFQGRWIRFGGRFPLNLVRIWRRGRGRIEQRWMDEHVVLSAGRSMLVKGDFVDANLNDLSFFTEKHNRYATREAIDVLGKRYRLFEQDDSSVLRSSSQAQYRRVIKEYLYNRVPFELAALAYFLWRYIFTLGFLDGRPGLTYHLLQGFWYRFLVGAKVKEYEAAIAGLRSKDDQRRELSRITGYEI